MGDAYTRLVELARARGARWMSWHFDADAGSWKALASNDQSIVAAGEGASFEAARDALIARLSDDAHG